MPESVMGQAMAVSMSAERVARSSGKRAIVGSEVVMCKMGSTESAMTAGKVMPAEMMPREVMSAKVVPASESEMMESTASKVVATEMTKVSEMASAKMMAAEMSSSVPEVASCVGWNGISKRNQRQ